MARKTQISKEVILQSALELLIRDGYSAINIKTLSKEIGCSTQPLVWHFENMDGLRKALAEYALDYANRKMKSMAQNSVTAFTEVGSVYVDIAFDTPHLFKYLYMNGGSDYCVGTFETLLSAINNPCLVTEAAKFFNISKDKALEYLTNTIIYSHGILTLVVSDVLKADKRTVKDRIDNAGYAFLLQAGGDIEKARKAENHLKATSDKIEGEQL